MIAEKAEELVALLQTQRLLSHIAWRNLNMATVASFVVVILGLLLLMDYGYMVYLHFKMVSLLHIITKDK